MGKFQTQYLSIPDPKEGSDNCLVNLIKHGDEMYATSETNVIRKIDPDTLDTLGPGVRHSDFLAVHNATAHPHTDEKGTVYNLGSSVDTGQTFINIIEFPAPRNNPFEKYLSAHEQAEIIAKFPCTSSMNPAYIHSFGMTENYFIIAEHPFGINLAKAVLSHALQTPVYKFIEYNPEKFVFFRILDRKTGKEIPTKYYASKTFVSFHTINSFEDAGHLVLDLCAGNEPYYELLHFTNLAEKDAQVPVTDVVRFVIPLDVVDQKEGNLVKLENTKCHAEFDEDNDAVKVTGEVIGDIKIEMPRINYKYNGKPYQYIYGVGLVENSLSETCLVKIDTHSGQKKRWYEPGMQVFEPVFVADPDGQGEDDGVILTPVLHLNQINYIRLLILDGKSLESLASVEFSAKGPVTPTLHGVFDEYKMKMEKNFIDSDGYWH